jgi:hypothetical protein
MKALRLLLERQVKLGAIIPGSIREQYTKCGKADCVCKDKVNPQKHGPYNQLSFSTKGKSSTMFVKPNDLKNATQLTESYKEHRVLIQEIGIEMIRLCREVGIEESIRIYDDLYRAVLIKYLGNKPESRKLKEADSSKNKWKAKAVERKSEIEKLQVKVRDLTKSRKDWKKKEQLQKKENQKLIEELADIKKLKATRARTSD